MKSLNNINGNKIYTVETIKKSNKIRLFRYFNERNVSTNEIRGGTWYSGIKYINRYKNHDKNLKIGGKNLSRIDYKYDKPFIVENETSNQDTCRSIVYDEYHYKQGKFSDLISKESIEKFSKLESIREDSELINFVKDNIIDKHKQEIILKTNFYPMKTMTADNILAEVLNKKGFDSFIRKDENGDIIEAFIIEKV